MTDTTTTTITTPRTTAPAESARLEFPRGARRLTLRVDAGMSALYRARFGGPRRRAVASSRYRARARSRPLQAPLALSG